jgi:hypothetical protein
MAKKSRSCKYGVAKRSTKGTRKGSCLKHKRRK